MKRNICFAISLLILLLAAQENIAQKLVVRMMNGLENAEPLSSIQKLYFNNNELIVDYYSGPEDNYFLSDVRKIYFDSTVGLDDFPITDSKGLRIYPNPVGEFISIEGIPPVAGLISIYRMDGGLILNMAISDNHLNIDVSGFQQGLYIVTVPGFTSKFVKK
jgi:hypothetical protein